MAEQAVNMAVFGSDEGVVSAEAKRVFTEWTQGTDSFAHEIIDGSCATVDEADSLCAEVIAALRTPPFFPGPKVVWLRGANFLGDTVQARSEIVQRRLEDLADCLGRLPVQMRFLLSAGGIDKRRSFFKKLQLYAECREFTKIDTARQGWETELSSLVIRTAEKRGLQFSSQALELFIHRVNESSRQIASELDKIDVYLGPSRRQVTEEDVELMVAVSRTGVVFEISRALEAGNCRQAIALVNRQLEIGEQPVAIMRAAVIPSMRNCLVAGVLMKTYGLSAANSREFEHRIASLPAEAQAIIPRKKDGSLSVYPIFLAARRCAETPLHVLKKRLAACADADRALVSSGLDARDIFYKLFAALTA